MIVNVLIIGLLLAGCPGKSDQRPPEVSPTPPTDNTNSNNNNGAGRGGGGGGHGAHGTNVADADQNPDPNDYLKKKTDEDPTQSTAQHEPEASTGQQPPQETTKTISQSPEKSDEKEDKTETAEKSTSQPSKTVEETNESATPERQPSPTASLSFIEQQGHLVPVLELSDATAVTDVEIFRPAHDFAIANRAFDTETTDMPTQTYYVKLKVQDRQCNNTVEIRDMTLTKTFKMNCP